MFQKTLQSDESLHSLTYVVDGGWLLHKVFWPHEETYLQIFSIYHTFLLTYFGADAIVVFDGYNNELIGMKSYKRYRRKEKNVGPCVEIAENTLVSLTQKTFLSNVANKFKFVDLLATFLLRNRMRSKTAYEGADYLIVKTALALSRESEKPVAIAGNYVNLLVLLTTLSKDTDTAHMYKIADKKNSDLYVNADSK